MRFYFILLLPFLLCFGEEFHTINRENVWLRKGPGSIYSTNRIIKSGVSVKILKNEPGWYKVRLNDELHTVGWISENALKKKKSSNKNDFHFSIPDSLTISSNSASGAIKGFFKTYLNFKDTDISFDFFNNTFFNTQEYLEYADRRNNLLKAERYVISNNNENIEQNSFVNNISIAVAVKILSNHEIISNSSDLKYINILGTYITQFTPLYDVSFKFFILKDDRLYAYALPNGYIFISQGLYNIAENEDELACILAHEISHVVCQHGAEELIKRSTQIMVDFNFNKLDQELKQIDQSEYIDDDYLEFTNSLEYESDSLTQSLESLSADLYNYATKKRQISYEYEADKYGVVYIYNLGYNPFGLLNILEIINYSTEREFYNSESNWQKDALGDRISKIESFITDSLHYLK